MSLDTARFERAVQASRFERCLVPMLAALPLLILVIRWLGAQAGVDLAWDLSLWLAAIGPVIVLFHRPSRLTWTRAPLDAVAVVEEESDLDEGERTVLLAAGLAHELGQPLSVARVSVEGLDMLHQLGREPSPDYQRRVLRDVGRALLSMHAIVDHLHELALHQRPQELQEIDLVREIDQMLAERRLWMRDSETPICWSPDDPPPNWALVDPRGLRLVVVNLLKNAVEAVALLPIDERAVELRSLGRGSLQICNRGVSMDPQEVATIFDPFVSRHARSDSERLRGVGLYLAQQTALRMRAGLNVHSSPEEGTRFTLSCQEPDRG